MADIETISTAAITHGGQTWRLLGAAVTDDDFKTLLNPSELNVANSILANQNAVPNFKSVIPDIISKYMAWKMYSDSGLSGLQTQISALTTQVDNSSEKLDSITETAEYVGGAHTLTQYSEDFSDSAYTHERAAKKYFFWYVISLIGFAGIVGLIFFVSVAEFELIQTHIAGDISVASLNTGILALKAALLFFAYQISSFFKRTFNAEKHLEHQSQHRCDVLQSLHAIYNSISNVEERDKVLAAGALFAYERGESGYISTKEGAGVSDSFESILAKAIR